MKHHLFSVDLGRGLGVIALGASDDEIIEKLKAEGIELDKDEEDPDWLYVDELGAVLNFKTTQPPRLFEIVTEDSDVHLGSLPVIGERVHAILDRLKIPVSETLL